jgi:hypothetical protein
MSVEHGPGWLSMASIDRYCLPDIWNICDLALSTAGCGELDKIIWSGGCGLKL